MEAESSKFLDVAAAPMNAMLEKEDRKVARERRQAKQKMTVAAITRHCTMHKTLERAHTTFCAIAQRIKQDKELLKLNLQNNKIIINIVFVSTKFSMFMFILFVCLLVQFADMCSFLLKQMRFASCTLLDSAET